MKRLLTGTALAAIGLTSAATAQTVPSAPTPTPAPASAPEAAIVVTARRLNAAREALLPSLGANKYTLGLQAIQIQPGGENLSLSKTLEQTPGVSQDNFGQIHVRNEHGNLQYRLNGIIVPEPIAGFGQVLDTRVADSIALITGSLPAQYGYRTSGVVDIKTRAGRDGVRGTASVYGGSYDTFQPSATIEVGQGGFSGFGSFSFIHNGLGIENPIGRRTAFHDTTEQYKGFGYVSQILSETTRASAIFGVYDGVFQIPNTPDQPQPTAYTLNGLNSFNSARINDVQREKNYYGTVALQYSSGPLTLQVAPFFRLSRTAFSPDVTGELLFNGIADRARLSSDLFGVQADGSYKAGAAHTLRFGVFVQRELTHSADFAQVFALDATGVQSLPDRPEAFTTTGRKIGTLYGVYAQDEWNPLPKLTINLGARFDRVEAYTREQQVSPRLSIVYKASDVAAFHVGYARNFTPPPQELIASTDLTLFAGTTKASAITTGDAVKAEREHLFDAGFNLTPLPHVTLSVDTYYKIKRNLLDDGQFGTALVLAPYNYARGYNYGVEVGIAYRKGPLNVYANVAAAEQRANQLISSQFFFQPAQLDYIASHYIFTDHTQKLTGSAGASYIFTNAPGKLTVAADVIYGSGLRRNPRPGELPVGQIHPNGSKLPAYEQVNLGLSQSIDRGRLAGIELRLDIVNLFDRVYQIRDGTGVGISAPQYGPRQAFYFGIAKRFG
jgi:outer membrane receptor protein involved in Fe transport